MTKILLKGGEVASLKGVFKKDLLISDGKIEKVDEKIKKVAGAEVIDCSGKLILPGLIDVHVHFREPGDAYKEDWENGSKAAVTGGVTTVFDMPNNDPPILSGKDLENKRKLIDKRSYVNFGLYLGYNGKNIDEINNASGIPGVKIFCAHSTGKMGVSDKFLKDAFEKIDKNKLLLFHAEDEECISKHKEEYLSEFEGRDIDPSVHSKIRAVECAVKMVKKLCEMAKKYNRPIHICHVTTEEELEIIDEYKKFSVTCEITPHHLTLSSDDYEFLGNYIKTNPPVRDRIEVFGLWKALKMGLVDIIATDHAPHSKEEKEVSYLDAPSGIPGVEMLLPILLNTVNNEGMTVGDVVYFCCEKPAEIFKVKNKGKVSEGYDADLVVVDMDLEKKFTEKDVVSKCGWSPYTGSVFKGWPVMTFVNGSLIYKEGKIVGKSIGKEVLFA